MQVSESVAICTSQCVSMATIRVCVAALACAAVVAAGGVGVTQGSTQRERRRRILQEDSSDSSPRSDSSSSSSGVDLNYIDAQRDKMHAVVGTMFARRRQWRRPKDG